MEEFGKATEADFAQAEEDIHNMDEESCLITSIRMYMKKHGVSAEQAIAAWAQDQLDTDTPNERIIAQVKKTFEKAREVLSPKE